MLFIIRNRYKKLYIYGKVKTTSWNACIKIRKTLEGSFTDPYTGEDLEEPTNLIKVSHKPEDSFPTKFNLTICVKNCGSTTLTDVIVTDTIKNTVGPRDWELDKGSVSWDNGDWDGVHYGFNDLTWIIGSLSPGEKVCLTIMIETLQNPKDKYEPTSGDDGDSQKIEVNEGATVKATSPYNGLTATTDSITLLITDDDIEDNGIGLIWVYIDEDTLDVLPYSTNWAKQSKSSTT